MKSAAPEWLREAMKAHNIIKVAQSVTDFTNRNLFFLKVFSLTGLSYLRLEIGQLFRVRVLVRIQGGSIVSRQLAVEPVSEVRGYC